MTTWREMWPRVRAVLVGRPFPRGTIVAVLHMGDGTTQEHEATYLGQKDGRWQYLCHLNVDAAAVDHFSMPVLPGHTEVTVAIPIRPPIADPDEHQ